MKAARTSIAAKILWGATGAAFGAAAMLAVRPASAALDEPAPCPRPDSFREVYRHVRNLALADPDEGRLYTAAVDGMLSSLDPYSQLISADDWKAMNGQLQGDVVGVGVEFEEKQGRLVTTAPIAGSPAAKAGVKPGMAVLSWNGKPARAFTPQQLSLAMLGAAGTHVTLRLSEKEGAPASEFHLARAKVNAPDVEGRLFGSDLAYVRVAMFQDGVARQVQQLVSRLRGQSGSAFKGMVIDLRHNPGGLLDEAIAMADLFVKDGTLVTATERNGRHAQEMKATGRASETGYSIVILVDGSTASAAEVFAAAMRERGRALLFGQRTYGKGTLQDYVPLEDGSALKITKAQYLMPSGRSLNGVGIEPDVAAAMREGKDGRPDDYPLKAAAYAIRNWSKFAPRLSEQVSLGNP